MKGLMGGSAHVAPTQPSLHLLPRNRRRERPELAASFELLRKPFGRLL
jgi:hypothetical protein